LQQLSDFFVGANFLGYLLVTIVESRECVQNQFLRSFTAPGPLSDKNCKSFEWLNGCWCFAAAPCVIWRRGETARKPGSQRLYPTVVPKIKTATSLYLALVVTNNQGSTSHFSRTLGQNGKTALRGADW